MCLRKTVTPPNDLSGGPEEKMTLKVMAFSVILFCLFAGLYAL